MAKLQQHHVDLKKRIAAKTAAIAKHHTTQRELLHRLQEQILTPPSAPTPSLHPASSGRVSRDSYGTVTCSPASVTPTEVAPSTYVGGAS
eukprot:6434660-Prorocentrum_lima.AAC.1